jgi:hypothetical protein
MGHHPAVDRKSCGSGQRAALGGPSNTKTPKQKRPGSQKPVIEASPLLLINRTKMFHVKHFGTIDWRFPQMHARKAGNLSLWAESFVRLERE